MSNLFKHFKTITSHRHKVIGLCKKAGIFWQGLGHDLSKYHPAEFLVGARFYKGTRSPNEGEREVFGNSRAWMRHKGRNRHHFEYWTDYNPATKKIEPVEMPIKYVIEMFCDRVAASKNYLKAGYKPDHPLQYFINAKHRRMIHPATSQLLEDLLTMLKEKGEDETFRFIRTQLLNKK
ncbi:MAG: DUF5662 family protein [Oscillospiraceae bacterium]|jgi:hypothetical protein|nr:DUF5662 family protein [Oscillospiraceae bacterium]